LFEIIESRDQNPSEIDSDTENLEGTATEQIHGNNQASDLRET
jgi:hypothetical protein